MQFGSFQGCFYIFWCICIFRLIHSAFHICTLSCFCVLRSICVCYGICVSRLICVACGICPFRFLRVLLRICVPCSISSFRFPGVRCSISCICPGFTLRLAVCLTVKGEFCTCQNFCRIILVVFLYQQACSISLRICKGQFHRLLFFTDYSLLLRYLTEGMPQRCFRLPYQILSQGQFFALCYPVFIRFQVIHGHIPFLADKVKFRSRKEFFRLTAIGFDYLDFSCNSLVYMGILINVVLHAPVNFHCSRCAIQFCARWRLCLHYLIFTIWQFHIAHGNAVFICRQGIQYLIIFIPYLEYGAFQIHLHFDIRGVLYFFLNSDFTFNWVVDNGFPIVVPVLAVFCL